LIFIEKNDIILCNLHILCYRAMFINILNILNIRKEIIMAHSKSSKKRVFIGKRNAERNQAIRSRVKTFVKKVLAAVEAKNVDEAKTALQVAYKELDKAVTKGVLKKNTVSRKKSRLALKVNSLAK
jgi:ribosomal protein S20